MTVAAEYHPGSEAESRPSPEWIYIQNSLDSFRHLHKDTHGLEERAYSALALAAEMRSGLGQTGLQTRTQLDALEWTVWNNLWIYSDDEAAQQRELTAKLRLFDDIEEYSAGKDEQQAHDELVDSLFTARIAVKNPNGILGIDKNMDRGILGEILATHRVIKALRYSGFGRTHYSGVTHRDAGSVAVPVGQGERAIYLRLQPGFPGSALRTQAFGKGDILVDLPFHHGNNSPFTMNDIDRAMLRRGVREMRAVVLYSLNLNPDSGEVA